MATSTTTEPRRRIRSSEEEYVPPLQFPVPSDPLLRRARRQRRAKRQRRSGNRTTEENGRPLNISLPFQSDFDIINEDFRTIGPVYIPLPVYSVGAPKDLNVYWEATLESRVLTTLKNNGIKPSSTTLQRRFTTANLVLGRRSAVTIFVVADKDATAGDSWYRAADAILTLCRDLGRSDLNVEIADARGLIRNVSRTVDPDHALVRDWLNEKGMFYRIMNALKNNTTWVNISLLSRGREHRHPKHTAADLFTPTVVIGIRHDSEEAWTEQAKKLEDLIHPSYPTVAIEILRGSCCFDAPPAYLPRRSLGRGRQADDMLRANHIGRRLLNTSAWVGASIGAAESKPGTENPGSATLGCFIVLVDDQGQKKVCGLTSFHVVASGTECPSDELSNEAKVVARGGLSSSNRRSRAQLPRLQMPSATDLQDFQQYHHKRVEGLFEPDHPFARLEKEVESLEVRGVERKAMVPEMILPHDMSYFLAAEKMFNESNRILKRCTELQRSGHSLGHVLAASGHRRRGRMLMDWALIEVDARRIPAHNDLEIAFLPGHQLWDNVMNKFSPHKADELAFKQGRTTGRTAGYVNAAPITHFRGFRWVRKKGPGELTLEYDYAWCQQIVDETHRRGEEYTERDTMEYQKTPFSRPGDDGSAVFDIRGSFKGLLVGGHEAGDYSCFIPVQDLFADICKFTRSARVEMLA